MQNMENFGETVRRLREFREMPLRKLAALLDIDQSTLSKIERHERNASAEMLHKIAQVFDCDYNDLKIKWLSDKIAYELIDEKLSAQILEAAEQKIEYLKKM